MLPSGELKIPKQNRTEQNRTLLPQAKYNSYRSVDTIHGAQELTSKHPSIPHGTKQKVNDRKKLKVRVTDTLAEINVFKSWFQQIGLKKVIDGTANKSPPPLLLVVARLKELGLHVLNY